MHIIYKWRKASLVFVCSTGHLFHEDVPFLFIDKVMDIIRRTPQHTYQLLTKQAERMAEYFKNQEYSSEPLLCDLGSLNLCDIDWIIAGGGSGPIARPMKEERVLNIKQQAEENAIPFFFKQWGTWSKDGIRGNKKKMENSYMEKSFNRCPK